MRRPRTELEVAIMDGRIEREPKEKRRLFYKFAKNLAGRMVLSDFNDHDVRF